VVASLSSMQRMRRNREGASRRDHCLHRCRSMHPARGTTTFRGREQSNYIDGPQTPINWNCKIVTFLDCNSSELHPWNCNSSELHAMGLQFLGVAALFSCNNQTDDGERRGSTIKTQQVRYFLTLTYYHIKTTAQPSLVLVLFNIYCLPINILGLFFEF
jgi:hypothetical protein